MSEPQRPAELPARVRGFTPRPEAQRLLDEIANRGEAGAVLITAIGGMGGIGKTTLAVAWARALAARFPDGQLYLNLRGFDTRGRVMSPDDALSHLLSSVGAHKAPAAESLEARSARFRSLMAGRAMLILLDNARDAEQVRPLLPGHEGCLVIVTSRNQLSDLVVHEGAVPVRLDRMNDEQARQLLLQRVGAERLVSDSAAVDRIVHWACGLPLALSIVAARLAVEPELTVSSVASELASADEAHPSVGYSPGPDELASVFAWSYDLLDPEEARTFRRLAVHPGSEMSLSSIASVAGLDLSSARRITDRLVAASLLQRRSRWFVVHDLLRDYALNLLSDSERAEAEALMVAHYVQTTRNAWGAFGRAPVGDLDAAVATAPVAAERFTDHHAAVDWYIHERDVLIALLYLAAERGWDRTAANLAIDWRPMNQEVDTDEETYPHARTALEAATRTEDRVLIAELHRDVGPKLVRLGRTAEGRAHLEKAQAMYEGLGDRVGQANVLRNLSAVLDMPMHERVRLLRTALDLVPGDLAPHARAVLMSDLALKLTVDSGSDEVDASNYLEGEKLTRDALDLARTHGWTDRISEELFHLTLILMALARPREALEVAADALRLDIDSPAVRAAFLIELTEAAVAVGDNALAVRSYAEASTVVEDVGASRLRQLVAAKLKFDGYDVVERLARLQGKLQPWTQAPAMTARNHAGTTSASE